MEKIKASEILAMNPKLGSNNLRRFKYFAIDKNGDVYIYSCSPAQFLNGWSFDDGVGGHFLFVKKMETPVSFWKNSLREIDFTEEAEVQHGFYPLFLHLSQEHDLTLTDEQLYEIVLLAKKIKLPYETQN